MKKTKSSVSLIGVPIDLGAHSIGVDMGPQALRYCGLEKKLTKAKLTVRDLGDITSKSRRDLLVGNEKYKYLEEIVRVCKKTAQSVEAEIKRGNRVITIGGDHSMAIGSISGASFAVGGDIGLIYIDAHGDFNTDQTTLSGNIHGMSFSAVCGVGLSALTNLHSFNPKLSIENTLHIGATDLDDEEEKLMKEKKVPMFDMQDVLARGLGDLYGMILALSQKTKNIWVSLDLDAIDSLYAPGVGIPSKGGFTYREIVSIAKYIGKKCNVIGIDIVEYNPVHDRDHITADLAIELSAKLLGAKYNEYTEYMDKQVV